jgi:uncharacterized cupredoxin-like copper-binding protein
MRNILIAAALLLAACQQETAKMTQDTPKQAEAPVQTTTSPDVASPQSDMPERRIGGAATGDFEVQLIEYAIRMPQTLPAGRQAFLVVNNGKELHSLEIEGNGVHARLPSTLSAGSDAHFGVELKPGTYTAYCPIPGHKEKGMTTTITVK